MTVPFLFSGCNIIPTEGQTSVGFFFSGHNYEPAETSKLVEPPQTFPLTARRLNLFVFGRIYEPARQLYFFSGRNYHSYRRPQMTGPFSFQVVIMNPLKHPSSWNPPNHSHWWPDNWTFFSQEVIMNPPYDCTFFGGGCNYHSYRRPDDCTFFFQVVTMNLPKHPSLCQDHNRISPTNGQTTVRFFSGCNYVPAKTSKLVEPQQTFPLAARRLSLFFGA